VNRLDRKSLERRLEKLESALSPEWILSGELPNGEQRYFDWKKILNLQYMAMNIYIPSKMGSTQNKIAPGLADFNEDDQRFIKDFVLSKLPKHPYVPESRRIFTMILKGDLAVHEQPLEDFIDPS
jgi:hypothetical protein